MENPKRRQVLKTAALGTASLTGITGMAAGDADPRPAPGDGTKPNKNVPETQVDPLPCDREFQNSVAPTGDWIAHSAQWVEFPSRNRMLNFLDNTTQTFVIKGETFVLEDASDWDLDGTSAEFRYYTPPKKPQTYQFSWDAVWDDGGNRDGPLAPFPHNQDIHIVEGKDANKDCL